MLIFKSFLAFQFIPQTFPFFFFKRKFCVKKKIKEEKQKQKQKEREREREPDTQGDRKLFKRSKEKAFAEEMKNRRKSDLGKSERRNPKWPKIQNKKKK